MNTQNKYKNKKYTLLDLFSGTGAYSLALESLCKTLAFCDKSTISHQVLQKNFPNIPIFDDITTLDSTKLAQKGIKKVDIISASFPCQDISIMNRNGKGLDGERSGLFYHIIRIANILDSKIIIMENSPNIKNKGIEKLISFLQQNGYNFEYDNFNASDLGAPHKRNRFYMIAYKKGKKTNHILSSLYHEFENVKNYWNKKFLYKKIIENTVENRKDLKKRTFLLGNAVVPQVVQYACFILSSKILEKPYKKINRSNKHNYYVFMKIPQNALIKNKKIPYDIILKKTYYSTPLSARCMHCKIGTKRSMNILQNQIMYDINILNYIDKKNKSISDFIVNPRFLEYMMGFPIDWTCV